MRKQIESAIENRLKKEVEKSIPGAKCYKWVCPGMTGVPDRIILLPGGKIAFVETKAPGKRERARQVYVQGILRKLGFAVFSSVSCVAQIAEVIAWCRSQVCEHEWISFINMGPQKIAVGRRCRKCGLERREDVTIDGCVRVDVISGGETGAGSD